MGQQYVMLVDDEADFVDTLAERLRMRGFRAQAVTDGHEALALVEQEAPHLMIVDVMMPGMSGLDLLKQVRRQYPDTRIILLTGVGSTKEGIEGMHLGAFDFLMKPINIQDLIDKMNEALAD